MNKHSTWNEEPDYMPGHEMALKIARWPLFKIFGRDDELKHLEGIVEALIHHTTTNKLYVYQGIPGAGKTRLLQQIFYTWREEHEQRQSMLALYYTSQRVGAPKPSCDDVCAQIVAQIDQTSMVPSSEIRLQDLASYIIAHCRANDIQCCMLIVDDLDRFSSKDFDDLEENLIVKLFTSGVQCLIIGSTHSKLKWSSHILRGSLVERLMKPTIGGTTNQSNTSTTAQKSPEGEAQKEIDRVNKGMPGLARIMEDFARSLWYIVALKPEDAPLTLFNHVARRGEWKTTSFDYSDTLLHSLDTDQSEPPEVEKRITWMLEQISNVLKDSLPAPASNRDFASRSINREEQFAAKLASIAASLEELTFGHPGSTIVLSRNLAQRQGIKQWRDELAKYGDSAEHRTDETLREQARGLLNNIIDLLETEFDYTRQEDLYVERANELADFFWRAAWELIPDEQREVLQSILARTGSASDKDPQEFLLWVVRAMAFFKTFTLSDMQGYLSRVFDKRLFPPEVDNIGSYLSVLFSLSYTGLLTWDQRQAIWILDETASRILINPILLKRSGHLEATLPSYLTLHQTAPLRVEFRLKAINWFRSIDAVEKNSWSPQKARERVVVQLAHQRECLAIETIRSITRSRSAFIDEWQQLLKQQTIDFVEQPDALFRLSKSTDASEQDLYRTVQDIVEAVRELSGPRGEFESHEVARLIAALKQASDAGQISSSFFDILKIVLDKTADDLDVARLVGDKLPSGSDIYKVEETIAEAILNRGGSNVGNSFIVDIQGPPGGGRTSLLRDFKRRVYSGDALGGGTIPDDVLIVDWILDLYHPDLHSSGAVEVFIVNSLHAAFNDRQRDQYRILEDPLGIFGEYWEQRTRFNRSRMAQAEDPVELRHLYKQVQQAFLQGYARLASHHRIVLIIDGIENLHPEDAEVADTCELDTEEDIRAVIPHDPISAGELFSQWLFGMLKELPNTVVVLSRRTSESFDKVLKEVFHNHINGGRFRQKELRGVSVTEVKPWITNAWSELELRFRASSGRHSVSAHDKGENTNTSQLYLALYRLAGGAEVPAINDLTVANRVMGAQPILLRLAAHWLWGDRSGPWSWEKRIQILTNALGHDLDSIATTHGALPHSIKLKFKKALLSYMWNHPNLRQSPTGRAAFYWLAYAPLGLDADILQQKLLQDSSLTIHDLINYLKDFFFISYHLPHGAEKPLNTLKPEDKPQKILLRFHAAIYNLIDSCGLDVFSDTPNDIGPEHVYEELVDHYTCARQSIQQRSSNQLKRALSELENDYEESRKLNWKLQGIDSRIVYYRLRLNPYEGYLAYLQQEYIALSSFEFGYDMLLHDLFLRWHDEQTARPLHAKEMHIRRSAALLWLERYKAKGYYEKVKRIAANLRPDLKQSYEWLQPSSVLSDELFNAQLDAAVAHCSILEGASLQEIDECLDGARKRLDGIATQIQEAPKDQEYALSETTSDPAWNKWKHAHANARVQLFYAFSQRTQGRLNAAQEAFRLAADSFRRLATKPNLRNYTEEILARIGQAETHSVAGNLVEAEALLTLVDRRIQDTMTWSMLPHYEILKAMQYDRLGQVYRGLGFEQARIASQGANRNFERIHDDDGQWQAKRMEWRICRHRLYQGNDMDKYKLRDVLNDLKDRGIPDMSELLVTMENSIKVANKNGSLESTDVLRPKGTRAVRPRKQLIGEIRDELADMYRTWVAIEIQRVGIELNQHVVAQEYLQEAARHYENAIKWFEQWDTTIPHYVMDSLEDAASMNWWIVRAMGGPDGEGRYYYSKLRSLLNSLYAKGKRYLLGNQLVTADSNQPQPRKWADVSWLSASDQLCFLQLGKAEVLRAEMALLGWDFKGASMPGAAEERGGPNGVIEFEHSVHSVTHLNDDHKRALEHATLACAYFKLFSPEDQLHWPLRAQRFSTMLYQNAESYPEYDYLRFRSAATDYVRDVASYYEIPLAVHDALVAALSRY